MRYTTGNERDMIRSRHLILAIAAWLMMLPLAHGQDYKQYYFNGKNFYREGKYNLAMESFKQAIPYDSNNPFSAYASFYFSLSAYHQGFFAVAKDMLLQVKKLHPNWDKMQEVDFWLGRIHMDNKEYFQGLNLWSQFTNPELKSTAESYTYQYLSAVEDVGTLQALADSRPENKLIGKLLAIKLAKNLSDVATRDRLIEVIEKYGLDRADYLVEAPSSYFKKTYTVSVLYPFLLGTLEPTTNRKRNQLLLDFYEGMQQAVDTLADEGISIDLRAYDTERKTAVIQRLLNTEELRTTDLIIGPFFPEENKDVQDFSMKQKINVMKPFTNNLEMIGINEFGFMLQPGYETLGRKSAEYMAAHSKRRRSCMVFYGTARKDSIQAATFVARAHELGLEVKQALRLSKDNTGRIIQLLASPTEFDEYKVPTQFTLPKDSLGGIYVASDDPLIFTKVISSAETRRDSILVIGSEAWLDLNATDLTKLQSQGIVLAAPNFMDPFSPPYRAFARTYLRQHGRPPSTYAAQGFDVMSFIGRAMHKYGVYFQEGFSKEMVLKGALSEGYSFPDGAHDNQLVPFIVMREGAMVVDR